MIELLKLHLKVKISEFSLKNKYNPDEIGILYLNKSFYFTRHSDILEELIIN